MIKGFNEKLSDRNLIKSIGLNVIMKPMAMIISLIYTPLLLNYLGDEMYGVWVTILSIVNWVNSFDVGIGNGLRNELVKDLNAKDKDAAKKSISTAYLSLTVITGAIFLVISIVSMFADWNSILNTQLEIKNTLFLSFLFICINFVIALYKNIYYAIQKSETVATVGLIVQLLNLVGVFFARYFISDVYRLVSMAYIFGLTSLITNVAYSVALWIKYPYTIPRLNGFSKARLNVICSLGIKFFIIQIAGIVLFTTDSVLISHLFTPAKVTAYNTVNKVFSAIFTIFMAVMAPMWSRFSLEKEKGNYSWMKNTIKKLLILWGCFSIGTLILVPIYPWISSVWLGRKLQYDKGIVIIMALYMITYMYSGIFSTIINGLGEIKVQMYLSIFSAFINIPLSVFLARNMGMLTTGIALGTLISILIGNVVFTIQVLSVINKGMKG